MPNRMTFMERMSGRLAAIESVLKEIGTGRKSLGAYYAAGKYHLHDQESFHISGSLHVYRGF